MSSASTSEELGLKELLAAINGDDEAAFRRMYRCYQPHLLSGVRRFIRKVPRLQSHEEDIVSRAWIRLLARDRRLLRSYDPNRASFGFFMKMVGANTAWKFASLRTQRVQMKAGGASDKKALEELHDDDDLEAWICNRELLDILALEVTKQLSEREQLLFEWTLVQQRSTRDIMEELGVSEEVVWKAKSRLRKKISTIMGEIVGGPREGRSSRRPVLAVLIFLSIGMGVDQLWSGGPSDLRSSEVRE